MSARPPFDMLATSVPITMSTRVIAELTDKRHDNVKRDTKAMLVELGLDPLKFEGIYFDGMNRQQTEYLLDRELTDTLLTGYSAVLRRKVIARWRQLEQAIAAPAVSDPLAGLPPEQRALIAVMVDNAAIKARQDEQAKALANHAEVQELHSSALEQIGHRVEQIAEGQVFTSCPSNAEPITAVRARINKKYGLPAWVINQVMAQMPYSLKPAGTVLNSHEQAQGSKYVIYWIRDVSLVFQRFVDECVHTTQHRARHPFVDAEFKLLPIWGDGK